MGILKTLIDSVFYAVLFYLFLGLLALHGLKLPGLAFQDLGVITAIIYVFVMLANYRL